MEEIVISKVAKVLDTWNPLGEKANSIESLDGYKYEAIDIISTIGNLTGREQIKRTIKQVLEQAFGISVEENKLQIATFEIESILKSER